MRRIRLLAAVAVLGGTCAMLGAAAPGAVAAPAHASLSARAAGANVWPQYAVWSLKNYNSHYCLNIGRNRDGYDTAALQMPCVGGNAQDWTEDPEYGSTGYYPLYDQDGQYLGVYQISTAEGAPVVGWNKSYNPDQAWKFLASRVPGYIYVENYNSKLVLGVLGNSKAEGAPIVQWANQHQMNNQLWEFIPAS